VSASNRSTASFLIFFTFFCKQNKALSPRLRRKNYIVRKRALDMKKNKKRGLV